MGLIVHQMDLSLSLFSLEPSALLAKDRLNIVGNLKHPTSELEFVIQYNKDDHPIVNQGLLKQGILLIFLSLRLQAQQILRMKTKQLSC